VLDNANELQPKKQRKTKKILTRWDALKIILINKFHNGTILKKNFHETRKRQEKNALSRPFLSPYCAKDPTTGEMHLFHRAHWHEVNYITVEKF